ncbi:MAG: hypothetical protein R3A79_13280 [Nannocystaceae bacterium]
MISRLLSLGLLPSLALCAACDRFGDPEDLGIYELDCQEVVTVLEGADAQSGIGFTAAEVLAVAAGSHTAPIFWHPGDVQFAPETGEGELGVDISYSGGEIRYVHATAPDAAEMGCVDRLEIDAEVALHTAGGALDETFAATLRSSRPDVAMIRHELAFDAIAGAFEVTAVEPANGEAAPISVEFGVSSFGLFGSLDGGVEIHSGDAVAFGLQNYATFPTDGLACDFPAEAPVPFDAAWAGASVDEALALLAAHPDLQLQWDGDAPTPLTIEATAIGAAACGRIDATDLSAPLSFDVAVTMKSEDGRLDGSLQLRAEARVDGEGVAELSIRRDAPYGDYAAVESFAEAFGVHGVDLSGYDGGGISFDLSCDADGQHGAITVLGAQVHECSDEPGAPCEGTDMIELASGAWLSVD